MYDALVCARFFRTFNVVDDFNYEALSIENDLNLSASQVAAVLCRIAEKHVVKLEITQSGKLAQNALSRVLTGHTEQKYSVICSERWMKSGNWRQTGCQNITVPYQPLNHVI